MADFMKEMVYSEHQKQHERIASGNYNGFDYYVLSLGTHPCAYIDVSDTSLNGVDFLDIGIDCHGGMSYSRNYLATVDKKGWFIGWDYAHADDFSGDYALTLGYLFSHTKRWTTEEIVSECRYVIDQLVDMQKESEKTGDAENDE